MAEGGTLSLQASTKLLWIGVFVALVIYGMSLFPGGYLHYEGQFFLSSQLDDRSLFAHLFSAHFNEWDCYQGRELSFAAGLVDAQLIVLGARLGAAHLYSLVTCICLVLTAVVLWRLLPKLTGIDYVASGFVVSLFLASPVAALSTFYYRPAKALAGLFLTIVLTIITRLTRSTDADAKRGLLILLVITAMLLGLSDRVGVYLIFAIAAIIAIVQWPLDRSMRAIVFALAAAAAINVVWSIGIGPYLARSVDGRLPDTTNELVAMRYTFGNFIHYRTALSLWLHQISFQLGSLGILSVITLAVPVAMIFRSRSGLNRRVIVAVIAALALAIALYTMMYAKLNSVAWPASRRVYYWIPGGIAIAVGVAFLTGRALSVVPRARPAFLAVLLLMLISSVIALPSHAAVVEAGEQRPQILEAPGLRECIRSGSVRGAPLSPAAAMACYRVRRAVSPKSVGNAPPQPRPNPLLYCRNVRQRQPALRSLGP